MLISKLTSTAKLLSCGIALAFAGCAQQQIGYQSSQFNRATAQSNLELILVNAARASKDFPLSFTRLAKYTSENMAKGSFSPDLPFGPSAASLFNLKPALNLSSGVANIEYGDLNNKEGLTGITAPLTYKEIEAYYHTNSSVPFPLIMYLSLQSVEITRELDAALMRNYQSECVGGAHAGHYTCKRIAEIKHECGDNWIEAKSATYNNWYFIVHVNAPGTKCGFLRFEAFMIILSMAEFDTDVRVVTKTVMKKNDAGKSVAVEDSAVVETAFFGTKSVQQVFTSQRSTMDKQKKGFVPIRFMMHSPKGMIQYLGDLIKLQSVSPDHYVPGILTAQGEVPIAIVKTGELEHQDVVLQVRDDEGQVFYVPRPGHTPDTAHLTMKTMTIISDFFNLRLTKDALPETAGLIFSAN